jgi:hypothetical protein
MRLMFSIKKKNTIISKNIKITHFNNTTSGPKVTQHNNNITISRNVKEEENISKRFSREVGNTFHYRCKL